MFFGVFGGIFGRIFGAIFGATEAPSSDQSVDLEVADLVIEAVDIQGPVPSGSAYRATVTVRPYRGTVTIPE